MRFPWQKRETNLTVPGSPEGTSRQSCFPIRDMSSAEAQEIWSACTALCGRDSQEPFRDSELPVGGFPTVVEAFARVWVDSVRFGLLEGREEELLSHFRLGIALFANSGPDWVVDAASLSKLPTNELMNRGLWQVSTHARDILSYLEERNMAFGAEYFDARVKNLLKDLDEQ